MFCENCGHQLQKGELFCVECGAPCKQESTDIQEKDQTKRQSNATPLEAPPHQEASSQVQVKSKVPVKLNRSSKWLLTLIVVLFAIFGGSYMLLQQINNPVRIVNEFYECIISKDVEGVKKYLYSSDSRIEMSDEIIGNYLNYLVDEQGNNLNQQKKEWLKQANNYLEDDDYESNSYISDFTLRKTGKSFFLLDKYQFEVEGYFLELSCNESEISILVNEEEINTKSSDGLIISGPYFPGYHRVKVTLESPYTNTSIEESVLLTFDQVSDELNTVKHYISLPVDYVWIDSDIWDATVYINGESTGKTVADIGVIGPVDDTTMVSLFKVFPFGEIKTEEKLAIDSPYFSFSDNSLFMDIAIEQMTEFSKVILACSNNQDIDSLPENLQQQFGEDITFWKESSLPANYTPLELAMEPVTILEYAHDSIEISGRAKFLINSFYGQGIQKLEYILEFYMTYNEEESVWEIGISDFYEADISFFDEIEVVKLSTN